MVIDDIQKLKKAKELLEEYKDGMERAQALARDDDLKLTEIETAIKTKKTEMEAQLHADIAESAFEEAKKIKDDKPKEAEELIAEARELLEEPPEDKEKKRSILAEIEKVFGKPEKEKEEKGEEEKEEEKTDKEGEQIKKNIQQIGEDVKAKRYGAALNKVEENLKLAQRIAKEEEKKGMIAQLQGLKDQTLKALALQYMAMAKNIGDKWNDATKNYMDKAQEYMEKIKDEYIKDQTNSEYLKTLSEFKGKDAEEETEEEEKKIELTGEGESEKEKPEESKDMKEILENIKTLNIFFAFKKIDEAIELVDDENDLQEQREHTTDSLKRLFKACVDEADKSHAKEELKDTINNSLGELRERAAYYEKKEKNTAKIVKLSAVLVEIENEIDGMD